MKSMRMKYKWLQNRKIHKAMNTLQQKNLFRLSAVLYAKTNDRIFIKRDLCKTSIHRQIST